MIRPGARLFSKAMKAQIVLEEASAGTEATCKRYGITDRTLRRWRALIPNDSELAAAVRDKKQAVDQEWAKSIPGALQECLRCLKRAASAARDEDLRNPDYIHAIAGALKMIAETDGAYKLIEERLRRARVLGQDGSTGAPPGPAPAGNVTPIRRTAGD